METETLLGNSLEAAKTGYGNAQEVIRFVDTKVGAALALLVLLIPAPLVFVGWQLGLEKSNSQLIWSGFDRSFLQLWFLASGFISLFSGGFASVVSVIHGINCVSPRAPRKHGENRLFHNEWKPNVIFPIFAPKDTEAAKKHFSSLAEGWDRRKMVADYSDQLLEVGRILDEKLACMKQCFNWLKRTLFLYALSAFMALNFVVWHLYWP
jgi:hypothetical protein